VLHCCLEYLAARAIGCPINVVDAINDRVASRVPSESRKYLSADRLAQIPNVDVLYTKEYNNTT
jgi:hypothetical protein